MSDIATKPTAEERKHIADLLRDFADKIEEDETITEIEGGMERPPRELDPLAGECPMDGLAHYEPGPEETLTVAVRREP